MTPVSDAFAKFDAAYGAMLNAAADVRRALAAEAGHAPKPPVFRIIEVVAEHYQLTPAAILSRSRTADVTLPRHVAIYLARTLTAHSYKQLGRVFNRNHGAVIHGFRTIEGRASVDRHLLETLQHLRTTCAATLAR